MAKRGVWSKAIDKGAATATAVVKTDRLENLMLIVDSTGDGVDSAFTMTIYSSQDVGGVVKTAVGIQPVLTGTRDGDGAIAFDATSITSAYHIPGVHPYIWIAITGVTDDILITIWLGGQEDY